MCTTPQINKVPSTPPSSRRLGSVQGPRPARALDRLTVSPLSNWLLYGEGSGPPGLQTHEMDRPQSLAPTPATSHNGQPDESRACRECQRRRVKCDGSMPECAVCQRYRRHCLYDKHSRTRLTRKYARPRSVLLSVSVSCD